MIAPAIAHGPGLGEQHGRTRLEDTVLSWLTGTTDPAGAGQLRAPARRRRGRVAGTAAGRLPAAASWPPAERGCCCRSSGCSRCRACRSRRHRRRRWPERRRRRCSSAARGPAAAGSADGGTGAGRRDLPWARRQWRWRSSWPRPASPRSGWTGSRPGWPTGCGCSPAGRGVDDRHRSLRSTLDWSYALLDEGDRPCSAGCRCSPAPFTAAAARAVVGDWPPVADADVAAALAGLAEQSLLVAAVEAGGDPLSSAGDHPAVRRRAAREGR